MDHSFHNYSDAVSFPVGIKREHSEGFIVTRKLIYPALKLHEVAFLHDNCYNDYVI